MGGVPLRPCSQESRLAIRSPLKKTSDRSPPADRSPSRTSTACHYPSAPVSRRRRTGHDWVGAVVARGEFGNGNEDSREEAISLRSLAMTQYYNLFKGLCSGGVINLNSTKGRRRIERSAVPPILPAQFRFSVLGLRLAGNCR